VVEVKHPCAQKVWAFVHEASQLDLNSYKLEEAAPGCVMPVDVSSFLCDAATARQVGVGIERNPGLSVTTGHILPVQSCRQQFITPEICYCI